MHLVKANKSFKNNKRFQSDSKIMAFSKASWVNYLHPRWLRPKVSLLDKENFTFSWQSSAGLISEKIKNWFVGMGRRHPNV